MNKLMHKRVFGKKGFTILELLVVVAIIAILAVIAVPQFMGAIEKSRVSAQIADINAVSKAATMYNFDQSKYPATAAKLTDGVDNGNVYINAFPAANKWNGTFTYETVTNAGLGLAGEYVLKMTDVPNEQAEAIDFNIDQVKAVEDDPATTGVNEEVVTTNVGLVRYGAAASAKADCSDVYYVIGK